MSLMLSQPRINVDAPIMPTAVFDPPVVRPGDRATYRVVLNALETSIEWPEKPPGSGNLNLTPGGRGQLLSMAGAGLQPSTTFNYHVRPAATGQFTVPAFTIKVYGMPVTIPAAQLVVTPDPPPSIPRPQEILLEIPATNIFVGQALRVRVQSPSGPGGLVQGLAQVQVTGEGILVDQATARGRVDALPRRAAPGAALTYVHELTITPIATGKLSVFAQGYAMGSRALSGVIISGPGVMPGVGAQYTLLDSDPVAFEVRPLPREGQLPGFTGAVGSFTVDPPQMATNSLRVGDPARLIVRVRGEGNLVRLVPPPPPRVRDWQVLAGQADPTHPQIIQAQGFTTFSYTLVPLSETAVATPEIPFSYFDPVEARYADCRIPSVPVKVAPGAMPVDLPLLAQAETLAEPREKEPVLSDLAVKPGLTASSLVPLQRRPWFPLLQLAPAAAFVGLWGWDRRRRFFENHPDALLRIRARRALRRQKRMVERAARRGDTAAFGSAAVAALRIASSPHYPAEPRALVGADVLALLPESERRGPAGEVVRRFFRVTDASRFGEETADLGELLKSRSDLDKLLERLEARLW
ncbi:MAG TPA: BatD family protein [Verrucomicrobiae bacterium]